MSEQIPSSKQEQPQALDSSWYKRYEDIAALQAYEYFDDPISERRAAARKEFEEAFERGEHTNPSLFYPKMESGQLEQDLKKLQQQLTDAREKQDPKKTKELENLITKYKDELIPSAERLPKREADLRQLKKEILASERNDVVKQAYRWRINEKIAELRMMDAAREGNMRAFERYTKFVYGDASPEVFNFTIEEVRASTEKDLTSSDEHIKQAAQRLLDVLPAQPAEGGYKPKLPESSLVGRVKQESQRVLAALSKKEMPTSSTDEIDAQGIYDMFTEALKNLNAEGWKVIVDTSSKTGISVDQENQTVRIPQTRKVTIEKLQGLMVHEIGTHVARRAKGERSRLMLLGLGLDRYEQGEEGVTTMREQSLSKKGAENFAGLEYHMAIGLAQGLDGKKRDFHDVYEVLLRHHQLKGLKEKKDPEEAKKSAWNQAVRVFRGTDCKTPGVAFTKDIIYRQGNIAVWEAIGKNPDELIRLNVGKYDPSNERHTWILTQLGITDEDLEEQPVAKS